MDFRIKRRWREVGGQLNTKTIAHLLEKDRINRDARARFDANFVVRWEITLDLRRDFRTDIPHLAKNNWNCYIKVHWNFIIYNFIIELLLAVSLFRNWHSFVCQLLFCCSPTRATERITIHPAKIGIFLIYCPPPHNQPTGTIIPLHSRGIHA